MNNHYAPTDEELDAILRARNTGAPNIENVKKRTMDSIYVPAKPVLSVKRTRRSLRIVLVAALVCALTIATIASTGTGINEKISNILGISNGELSPSASNIDKSITVNGITFTVKQTLGDENTLYILTDFTFPAGIIPNENLMFKNTSIQISGIRGYGYGYDILDIDGQTMSVFFTVTINNQKLNGKDITLSLDSIGYYDPQSEAADDTDFVPLVSGNWTQEWTLQYENLTQSYNVNTRISCGKVRTLRISPLSWSLDLTLNSIKNYHWADSLNTITLHYNDGTSKTYEAMNRGNESVAYFASYQGLFPQAVSIDNLKSVTIDGVEILLN